MLARALNSPTIHNALEANKVLRYLRGSSEVGICHEKIQGKLCITAFTDAAFQNINNEETQGGMLICIHSRETQGVNAAVLDWHSLKLRRVVRSTFAGETIQCSTTFDSAVYLRDLMDEVLEHQVKSQVFIRTDCKSLVDHIHKTTSTCLERRLKGELFALKQAIKSHEIDDVVHVSTDSMVADGLTKSNHKLRGPIVEALQGIIPKL
jgi:hypothetical protein